MAREINLDGGEVSVLKAMDLSGRPVAGKFLVDRISEMEAGEFVDTLSGLISLGYVLSDKVNIRTKEDVERSSFRVNPSYAHDLRDALHPARRHAAEQRRRRRG